MKLREDWPIFAFIIGFVLVMCLLAPFIDPNFVRRQMYEHCLADGNKDYQCAAMIYYRGGK